ncbi:MAG: response regulator transcription factor, partial [Pseudobdellovibrionaceae bacterium]
METPTPAADKQAQILVVEDEQEIRELISLHLLRLGFSVREVTNGEEAIKLINNQKFDLLVMDWMLPNLSGIDIVRHLRSQKIGTPVLMVTAKTEPHDIVTGLESGADDYITKPFDPGVLTARVRALLRRADKLDAATLSADSEKLKVGNLELNFQTYEVSCCGEQIHLTPSEFKLIGTLIQNRGRVLTRDRLVEEIQGEGISVVGRTIDTHVF